VLTVVAVFVFVVLVFLTVGNTGLAEAPPPIAIWDIAD
jgi:hypothetical protein